MKVGIDLVYLPDFYKRIKSPGLAEKLFTQNELKINKKEESLAGVFAAKEAFMKALGHPINWQDIDVLKKETGEPKIESSHLNKNPAVVSISHAGDYATAIVIIL